MFLACLAILVVLLDQYTKYLIQTSMEQWQSIPVIPGIFHITYIQNPGAAFGMLPYKTVFFILITLIIIGVIIYYYRSLGIGNKLLQASFGLIVGGAIGNLIDRVKIGKVVDFLDFRIWPVFNVADIAICIGVGLVFLYYFLHKEEFED